MANNTVYITLPVGEQVVKNITNDYFEKRLINLLFASVKRLQLPSNHENVILTSFILILALVIIVLYIVKYRHRLSCQRHTNEAQHNAG